MLIYSMSVSVDGFIADREGAFEWTAPSEELFRFHTALVSELGGCRYHARGAAAGSTISLEADFTKQTSDAEAR
jgi:hypothetical protein